MRQVLVRSALTMVSLLAVSDVTQAAIITYSYAGTCASDCDEVGLNAGDAVTGSIAFLDSELIPGSPYPHPVAFSFQFGSVLLDDTATVEIGLFDYPLPAFPGIPDPALVPADLTSFVAQLHIGATGASPLAVLAIAPVGDWLGTADGSCGGVDCSFVLTRGEFARGEGEWSSASSSVPEPTTLIMLTTGVLGLLARHRARSRTTTRHDATDAADTSRTGR
jgi:PEP-CTERM motif